MSSIRIALIAAASAFALAACQNGSAPETDAPVAESEKPVEVTVEKNVTIEEVAGEAAPVEESDACAVLESSDWAAWINKMPGVNPEPSVHVTGKVTMRTGGFTFEWQEGPMDRSAIPALRLKLVPVAPDGMATMAITTEEVNYTAPALSSGYSRVIVGCGDTVLAEITEITDAH
jgi:hypothetical protein